MEQIEIVRTFLNGFNDPAEIRRSLDLLSDTYHFRNPMLELHSKEAFIDLANQIGGILTGVEILNIAQSGHWVAVRYSFSSSIEGLETNMATEWFRIEGDKIVESELIYDASKWRKVYAQMQ